MPTYKVLAVEQDNTELSYQTEVPLSAVNTSAPTTSLNTATNVQQALANLEKINFGQELSSTTLLTVNTTNYANHIDTALTVTPGAGTFRITFTADTNMTGVNAQGEVQMYKAGTAVPRTLRQTSRTTSILGLITLSTSGGYGTLAFSIRETFAAGEQLTIRYRLDPTDNSGTMQVYARSLLVEQVGL